MPKIDSPAPPFNLPSDGGKTVQLEDYRGQMLVVYFYPKDDTPGCTQEAIEFNGLRDAFAEAGAAILGVSPDSSSKHEKFKAKHELALTLAADEKKTMLEAYGVWKEKSMYGRKYMGVERTTFLIDGQGVIREIWENVKVPGHAKAVLEAVHALGASK